MEIPYSRTERKYQQMLQGKDMIGETRCINVILLDFKVTFVVVHDIEYMR